MEYKVFCSTVKDGNMSFKYGEYDTVLNNVNTFLSSNNIDKSIKITVFDKDEITCLEDIEFSSLMQTDSLVTKKENIFMYICFGDCIPMILYDKKQSIVSLTHLGWPSVVLDLQKKIVNYYIDRFNSDINDLEVVIGPSIKKDSYILENPVQLKMPKWEKYIEKTEKEGFYKVDLNSYVYDSLKEMNIDNIINSSVDTATNSDFFSHHRYLMSNKTLPEGRFIYGVMLVKDK